MQGPFAVQNVLMEDASKAMQSATAALCKELKALRKSQDAVLQRTPRWASGVLAEAPVVQSPRRSLKRSYAEIWDEPKVEDTPKVEDKQKVEAT